MDRKELVIMDLKELANSIGYNVADASGDKVHGGTATIIALCAIIDTLADGKAHEYFNEMQTAISKITADLLYSDGVEKDD